MTVKNRKPRSGNKVIKSCVSMQVLYVQNNSVIHSILLITLSDMPQVFGRMLFEYLTSNKQISRTDKPIFINSGYLYANRYRQLYPVGTNRAGSSLFLNCGCIKFHSSKRGLFKPSGSIQFHYVWHLKKNAILFPQRFIYKILSVSEQRANFVIYKIK